VAFAIVVALHAPGARAQTAEIRLVVLPSASGSDTVTTLPTSSPRFRNDASFVVEVWAQATHANGLSSASADIAFTTALADVTNITHSATFNVLTAGTINNTNGTIDDLSGSHLGPCSDAVAVSPNWARVAILSVTASANGSLSLQTGPTNSAIYGTAICGVGDIADAQIVFGSVSVDLVECLTDGECDDGQFCNGPEACSPTTFTCQTGTPPDCDDGFACTVDACDPLANGGAGGCVYTPNHALCNNMLFCDGVETCDAIQGCLNGVAPCTAECEHCVESADACELCILDLDGSGAMGTGDFSFFAPCFGACYSPGHPCFESNFNGDAGGCVGTSDFAAFVGCFGSTCGQCAGCAGPGAATTTASASDMAATGPVAAIRLAVVTEPSDVDRASTPPPSIRAAMAGRTFMIEVWAKRVDESFEGALGLAAAYVDLSYDPGLLSIIAVQPTALFSLFPDGHDEHGTLRAVGGCAMLGERSLGADGMWVRAATITARAETPGTGILRANSSDPIHGIALIGEFENIDLGRIDFEEARLVVKTEKRAVRDGRIR